jgi:hypothetical protein
MYRQVQTDTIHTLKYSEFEGNIFGTPSLAQKSGSVTLGIVNILEAKIFERNDTTGKPKKVKLIDNFSINTSYNIFADKFKWAPVSMQIRTTILNNVNISGNGSFTLYDTDPITGAPINSFLFTSKHKLMNLNNFSTGIDFSLSELLKRNKDKNKPGANASQVSASQGMPENIGMVGPASQGQQSAGSSTKDVYGYSDFNIPWTMNLRYNLSYTNSSNKSKIDQFLSFDGAVTITKKMSATYSSGYDFDAKKLTYTTIGINRDLHCWDMSINWVPIGSTKGWNFLIRVKASVLGDLKYERRKDFHDSY